MGKIIEIKDYIIENESILNEDNEEDCITEMYDDVEIRVKKANHKENDRKSGLVRKGTIKK